VAQPLCGSSRPAYREAGLQRCVSPFAEPAQSRGDAPGRGGAVCVRSGLHGAATGDVCPSARGYLSECAGDRRRRRAVVQAFEDDLRRLPRCRGRGRIGVRRDTSITWHFRARRRRDGRSDRDRRDDESGGRAHAAGREYRRRPPGTGRVSHDVCRLRPARISRGQFACPTSYSGPRTALSCRLHCRARALGANRDMVWNWHVCVAAPPPRGNVDAPLGGEIALGDDDVRAALQRHWDASDANDFATEHQIYRADAVLEYPQSGERIRGRANIQGSRPAQPNLKRFTVRRMLGSGGLWVSELVMTYDGKPSYVVSIMEFEGAEVVRESQYFSDPFEPGPSRAQWVEKMD